MAAPEGHPLRLTARVFHRPLTAVSLTAVKRGLDIGSGLGSDSSSSITASDVSGSISAGHGPDTYLYGLLSNRRDAVDKSGRFVSVFVVVFRMLLVY